MITEYEISAVTQLNKLNSLNSSDSFLIGRGTGGNYTTWKVTYDQISSDVYNAVKSLIESQTIGKSILTSIEQMDKISPVEKLHDYLVDAYLIYQVRNQQEDAIDKIYPISSLYITLDTRNPNSILGIGTWTKVSSGKCLMTTSRTSEAGKTLESKLPIPTITATDKGHTHTFSYRSIIGGGTPLQKGSGGQGTDNCGTTSNGKADITATINEDSVYVKNQKTVQPPSILVNVWQRTA